MRPFTCNALLTSAFWAVAAADSRTPGGLDVVKTAVLPDGQIIDWVRRESQDKNFSLPADYELGRRSTLIEQFSTPIPEHLRGPYGTVPIARRGLFPFPDKKPLPAAGPLGTNDTGLGSRQEVASFYDRHWYASTSNPTPVTGGGGFISMYKPYLASPLDFSLLETAIVRYAANTVEHGTITQSIEAGWLFYPMRGRQPMFFTFFNANGYQAAGDYLCGWNTEQRGWVQVDPEIYPGMAFDRFSVVGGVQYDFEAKYHLHDGKWWLKAFGRDIGYYPADLFLRSSPPADTLASHGDRIDFYGEVYNSGLEMTTTDMGSGEFPQAGDYRVGYFRNMIYLDQHGQARVYLGHTQEDDPSRYGIQTFWNSGTSWGSYVYVGGPGAGGVIGG